MKHRHDISPADVAYIADCLGREATQLLAVAARDASGKPAVITCHPLKHSGKTIAPFPTMYWLIDPARCHWVADLERRGVIGEIELQIAQDESLRDAVARDHRAYAASRWALLREDEKQLSIDAGFVETLRDKGIGGIACFDAIKCLHLHLAHHLAELAAGRDGTTVGKLIESRLGVRI